MRRLLLLLTLAWLFAALPLCALAESLPSLLGQLGLTGAQAEVFMAQLASQADTPDGQTVFEALSALAAADPTEVASELIGNVYADARGFSAVVPEGWTVVPSAGQTVAFQSAPDAGGFASTITVNLQPTADETFFDRSREEIDALLSRTLQHYRTIEWDAFSYQNLPAHELVCIFGADEASLFMQYQLSFVQGEDAYLITLTTLAEEAIHEEAVAVYDTFLEEFIVFSGLKQGNG